jgi:hypothetical protein
VDWEALVGLQQLLMSAARAVVKSSSPEEVAGKKGATAAYVPKTARDSSQANQPLDPPPRRPEWEQLPRESQAQAMVLLTELLLSPAGQRLLSQGGANE